MQSKNNNSKNWKIFLIFLFGFYTLVISIKSRGHFRVQSDEIVYVPNIISIVNQGSIQTSTYTAGAGYQITVGTYLKLFNIDYASMQILSPLLGLIFITVLLIFLYQIWKLEIDKLLPHLQLVFLPSIFIFASFVNRYIQSSHKKFTITLFIVSIYALFVLLRSRSKRFLIVLIVGLFSMSLFSYLWTIVYTTVLLGCIIVSRGESTKVYISTGLGYLFAFLLANYHNFTRFHKGIILTIHTRLLNIFSSSVESTSKVTGETVGLISQWPIISIGWLRLSSWYVWMGGIFIIALCSGLITIYLLYRYYYDNTTVYENMIIGINFTFSIFILAAVLRQDVDTVRRIAALPGILSMLSMSIVMCKDRLDLPATSGSKLVILLIIMLIISSFLAVPRHVTLGEFNPNDQYAEENQVHKIDFYMNHRVRDCLITTRRLDQNVLRKKGGSGSILSYRQLPRDKIYSSGNQNKILRLESCPIQ